MSPAHCNHRRVQRPSLLLPASWLGSLTHWKKEITLTQALLLSWLCLPTRGPPCDRSVCAGHVCYIKPKGTALRRHGICPRTGKCAGTPGKHEGLLPTWQGSINGEHVLQEEELFGRNMPKCETREPQTSTGPAQVHELIRRGNFEDPGRRSSWHFSVYGPNAVKHRVQERSIGAGKKAPEDLAIDSGTNTRCEEC